MPKIQAVFFSAFLSVLGGFLIFVADRKRLINRKNSVDHIERIK